MPKLSGARATLDRAVPQSESAESDGQLTWKEVEDASWKCCRDLGGAWIYGDSESWGCCDKVRYTAEAYRRSGSCKLRESLADAAVVRYRRRPRSGHFECQAGEDP
jgi:hypothetical protein